MSLTLFQQYEQRRKSYKPGAIWVAKSNYYTVAKLEVLPKDTPDVWIYDDSDEVDFSNKNLVPFLIKESESHWDMDARLKEGCKLSWSRAYMEVHYKPIFESTL
jgi:hypothetical protein